ncbi:putative ribonuclease H-like domain-containing protein [Tanacetum coccineum]
MNPDLVSVNTARQVNVVHSKTTVNAARPMSYLSKIAHSTVKRTIHKNTAFKNSNINQRVNTVKGNNFNVVKASACWVWKPKHKVLDHGNPQMNLQDQGVIDSGCSKHMTGNMSYLTKYKEIDGGYVAFGGNPKGGKITGKGTIKTGNLDFENLIDESQVLLRVPRKNNMYSVDLKNIVPKGGLTCLFAKATSDESKLWHRRLGHLNFKTMNKLVKGNLVRGLPSKLFENDQTCVACQKIKQHKAFCKSKTENSISLPLHLLHMDLFGPTFVKILMKKMYCLVVTDDYSRFTWVFFLATKDETSGILKSFITGIENLVYHKVKVIRSRTPQQNGVAERRNRTLIEATRTMLADSKFPTTFWAEAVNTACYVHSPNGFVGTKSKVIIASQAGKETEPCQRLHLATIMNADPHILRSKEVSHDDGYQTYTSSVDGNKEEPKKGSKWVFRIKRDEMGIKIRNKTRLVAQGYTQEEGIDYDEIKEEVYVCQPSGFKDPDFPDRVYKKKDGIFISQDKYVEEILKKFGFTKVKTASTPIETQKPLIKEEDGEEVDVHMYRSMIGSLMYLTSSRPDIMYLKGQLKLGPWYPKDSPFDLITYTDSDYAGASLDMKSIIGGKANKGVKLIMEKLFRMDLELMLVTQS